MEKKMVLTAIISITATLLISVPATAVVIAEQTGSTPESGVTSHIKQIYNSLVSLGHGADSAGVWGNWGAMWNRIKSAGEWMPDGSAESSDVVSGQTFYGDSRTLLAGTLALTGDAGVDDVAEGKSFYSNTFNKLIGTAQIAQDYSLQQYNEYDDWEVPDYQGDESVWTNTATNVWRDERTGLYWSNNRGGYTNFFPNQDHSSCDFFSSDPRGAYDGLDSDCGNAINTCGTLSLDADGDAVAETNWYLPTQKEVQQAYVDGMYNQAGAAFAEDVVFWTSSEVSYSSGNAWFGYFVDGNTGTVSKGAGYSVRCVCRD